MTSSPNSIWLHRRWWAPQFANYQWPAHLGRGRLIIKETAKKYGLKPSEITGPSRDKRLVLARNECAWRIRNELGWTLPRIGEYLNRDHTSILHGIRRHDERIQHQ